MRKNEQLFHDMVANGVKHCDPNCKTFQWLRSSYCQKTTLEASYAQEEDAKWEQLISL